MQDRTPKYPGRVKLLPVAGQENIYDMTRADEPDDTGTPFNKRTMLQDSTGRFLRLPVSNPFVDDALRHMPDRIEPIGTVKTSPALSLGDAWLPCDGSQVTFAQYPQLCQMLRKTVGSPTWDTTSICSDLTEMQNSRIVYFKEKWYVAISGLSGNDTILRIYGAETLQGTWALVKSYSITPQNKNAYPCALACSDELLLAAWTADTSGGGTTVKLYGTTDTVTWQNRAVTVGNSNQWTAGTDVQLITDGAYWIMHIWNTGALWGTTNPLDTSTWIVVTEPTTVTPDRYNATNVGLSYINGRFFVSRINTNQGSTGLTVFASSNPGNGWTLMFSGEDKLPYIGNGGHHGGYITRVVHYAGMYRLVYSAYDGYSGPPYDSLTPMHLLSFTDNDTYENIDIASEDTNYYPWDLAASDKMLALVFLGTQGTNQIVTSSEPSAGFSDVTLSGGDPDNVMFDGDVALAIGNGAIFYHDYSNDARLLPTISLSDDTTTYIKAKNELDVFEEQESGGD